jgi:DNA-binding transcriptional ArsR family regulator
MRNRVVTYCGVSSIDRTMSALSDPTRRSLLRKLANGRCRAGALATGFAISRPAICKHTRLLTRAGLIRSANIGRERIYELSPRGRAAIGEVISKLEEVERFWDLALDSFKRYAESKR